MKDRTIVALEEAFLQKTGLKANILTARSYGAEWVMTAHTKRGEFTVKFEESHVVGRGEILLDAITRLIRQVPKPRQRIPLPTDQLAPRLIRRPVRITA